MFAVVRQALQVSSNYRELEKKYGALTSMISSQNQIIGRLEKQCQCRDSSSQVRHMLFMSETFAQRDKKCVFCVGVNRWWQIQQTASVMSIIITALKPTKWSVTFKGIKVLPHHCKNKQEEVPWGLRPTHLLWASLSQNLQVLLCQAFFKVKLQTVIFFPIFIRVI